MFGAFSDLRIVTGPRLGLEGFLRAFSEDSNKTSCWIVKGSGVFSNDLFFELGLLSEPA